MQSNVHVLLVTRDLAKKEEFTQPGFDMFTFTVIENKMLQKEIDNIHQTHVTAAEKHENK